MSQPFGVCLLVINDQNQILLGKRKNSYKAGFYGLPGGRIEVGEKLEETARRELSEETGLEAKNLEYLGFVKELQETYDFVHFIFVCSSWNGEPHCIEPDKCEGWEWFELSQLPSNILPGHRQAIKLFTASEKLGFIEV